VPCQAGAMSTVAPHAKQTLTRRVGCALEATLGAPAEIVLSVAVARADGLELEESLVVTLDGRPIAGLESAEFQVNLFATMPEALSKQLLAATLEETTYTAQSPQELYRIWRAGDVATLDKLMKDLRQRYPELSQLLLTGRNRAWLPRLTEALRSDVPHLVVVGAAHFVGPEGLLALLKAQGFEPKPAEGVIELAEPPENSGSNSGSDP